MSDISDPRKSGESCVALWGGQRCHAVLLCDTRAKTLPPHGVPHLTSEVREQSTDVDGASPAAQAADSSARHGSGQEHWLQLDHPQGALLVSFLVSSWGTAMTELRPAQRRSWLWLHSVIPESGEAGQERE